MRGSPKRRLPEALRVPRGRRRSPTIRTRGARPAARRIHRADNGSRGVRTRKNAGSEVVGNRDSRTATLRRPFGGSRREVRRGYRPRKRLRPRFRQGNGSGPRRPIRRPAPQVRSTRALRSASRRCAWSRFHRRPRTGSTRDPIPLVRFCPPSGASQEAGSLAVAASAAACPIQQRGKTSATDRSCDLGTSSSSDAARTGASWSVSCRSARVAVCSILVRTDVRPDGGRYCDVGHSGGPRARVPDDRAARRPCACRMSALLRESATVARPPLPPTSPSPESLP